jgi:hypothetical protein
MRIDGDFKLARRHVLLGWALIGGSLLLMAIGAVSIMLEIARLLRGAGGCP